MLNCKDTEPFVFVYFSLAIDCGPLRVPFNGSSTGNLTVYPNEIQFYCDSGFFLDGASRRFCLSNGTWSGLETSCKRKNQALECASSALGLCIYIQNVIPQNNTVFNFLYFKLLIVVKSKLLKMDLCVEIIQLSQTN